LGLSCEDVFANWYGSEADVFRMIRRFALAMEGCLVSASFLLGAAGSSIDRTATATLLERIFESDA
jgi:hypothetical protein